MKNLKTLALLLALLLALPLTAQDFGYPKDKAFYKSHWNEVLKDLGDNVYIDNAQYVLFDFDKDGQAELYLWFSRQEEYLYAIQGNKAVRVSETARPVEDQFWLGSFYPHFMAPYQYLLDKPVPEFHAAEQHIYDMFDVPRIWFGLRPKIEGKFGIKSAIDAICCFDCRYLSDALYALVSGEYDKDNVSEYVVDAANGYAKFAYKEETIRMVELCYWNLANGEKLLAMHFHISCPAEDEEIEWFEQTLFMKYNPKTQYMEPVVAPIKGFDFQAEYNFSLPRRGKNITLIGADNHELKWTGNGFEY